MSKCFHSAGSYQSQTAPTDYPSTCSEMMRKDIFRKMENGEKVNKMEKGTTGRVTSTDMMNPIQTSHHLSKN